MRQKKICSLRPLHGQDPLVLESCGRLLKELSHVVQIYHLCQKIKSRQRRLRFLVLQEETKAFIKTQPRYQSPHKRDTPTCTRTANSTTKREFPEFWLIAEARTPEIFFCKESPYIMLHSHLA